MAVPILKQSKYLIATIQSALTDSDLVQLRDALVERVGSFRSRGVIIDVTALDVLPLTANGKLDTARLPAPVAAVAPARETGPGGDEKGDSEDELTGRLREIWSEVLGRPVGLDDDFFELGGNSLFAVRIGAALRAHGLPSLRLRELYRHPTVRDTARNLAATSG